jgi:protein-S-isoprenylcysteine O-methyltransferase Ste14
MADSSASNRSCLYGWAAFALTVALFVANAVLPHSSSQPAKIFGVLLLATSVPLIFAPFHYLKKHGQIEPGKAYYETTTVVEQGPYRLIRHPQYLGYALLVCGLALLSCHIVTGILALLSTLLFYLQAIGEEKLCLQTLGIGYQEYMDRVPRFNLIVGIFRQLSST